MDGQSLRLIFKKLMVVVVLPGQRSDGHGGAQIQAFLSYSKSVSVSLCLLQSIEEQQTGSAHFAGIHNLAYRHLTTFFIFSRLFQDLQKINNFLFLKTKSLQIMLPRQTL